MPRRLAFPAVLKLKQRIIVLENDEFLNILSKHKAQNSNVCKEFEAVLSKSLYCPISTTHILQTSAIDVLRNHALKGAYLDSFYIVCKHRFLSFSGSSLYSIYRIDE